MNKDNKYNYYNDPRLQKAIDNWDIFAFLSNNNVNYFMDGENIGKDFIGINPCPQCGDTFHHFAIHTQQKYGSCWICKCYYGPLALVMRYGHMDIKDAFNYLINLNESDLNIVQQMQMILNNNPRQQKPYAPSSKDQMPLSKKIKNLDLTKNKALQKLFIEKQLYLWHVNRYNIRLVLEDKFKYNIAWPIIYNNKQVSYQTRSYLKKRYYIPTNLSNYIYGEDWIIPNKPLILVEGFFDYTRVDTFIRCYYPSEISITTGLVKSISQKQITRIIHKKPSCLIIIFDNDSWFDYYRLKNIIPFDVHYVIIPKGKDPNELTWNELKTIFNKEIKLWL